MLYRAAHKNTERGSLFSRRRGGREYSKEGVFTGDKNKNLIKFLSQHTFPRTWYCLPQIPGKWTNLSFFLPHSLFRHILTLLNASSKSLMAQCVASLFQEGYSSRKRWINGWKVAVLVSCSCSIPSPNTSLVLSTRGKHGYGFRLWCYLKWRKYIKAKTLITAPNGCSVRYTQHRPLNYQNWQKLFTMRVMILIMIIIIIYYQLGGYHWG